MSEEGRRARKKREMRERIYHTARTLFSERGFDETKVEDIAAELDVSTATVFNYFGTKDALLLEMAEEMLGRFERVLEQLGEPGAGDGGVGPRYLALTKAAFADAPPLNRGLCVQMMRVALPPETGQRMADRLRASLETVIRNGQERGEIRTDLDAEFLAEMAANLLTGALSNWVNDPRRPLMERLARCLRFLQEATRAA